MDDHQTFNVKEMVGSGGARSIPQSRFTAKELAKQMQKMALQPGALENAARFARSCGRPEAVSDLADLVESIGTSPLGKTMKREKEAVQRLTARKEALAKDAVQ